MSNQILGMFFRLAPPQIYGLQFVLAANENWLKSRLQNKKQIYENFRLKKKKIFIMKLRK